MPAGVTNIATLGASVMIARIGYARSQPSVPRTAKYVMEEFETARSSSPAASRRMFSCEPLVASAESDWCDVQLARINPFGDKMDAEPEKVAPSTELSPTLESAMERILEAVRAELAAGGGTR